MPFINLPSVRGAGEPVSGSALGRILRRPWLIFSDSDDGHVKLKKPDDTVVDLEAGGGGFTPVTCNLLAPASDVSTAASHSLLWSALQDNPWSENALLAIPADLGVTFAFDGTDSTLTTTVAGTWALSLSLTAEQDAEWSGHYDDGLWGQSSLVGSSYGGFLNVRALIVGVVMTLPSGAQLQPAVVTDIAADQTVAVDASLIITRLA